MKACVLHAVGDLRTEEVPIPFPGEDEALVRVGACGVCGSDVPRIFEKGTYSFPTIPGHEMAGVVERVGSGVDRSLVGTRVAVFPLVPCGTCTHCAAAQYAQCNDYNYLGSRCDGGFAEYVCAPVWNLLAVPEGVTIEEAAMTEPAAVAVHALRQGGIDVGDTVAIFGAGPVGVMVGKWAKACGASGVLLIDLDPRRLEFAGSIGFAHRVNAAEHDPVAWVLERTQEGADLVVEGSGSSTALEQCLHVARTFGRVVLMGNPAGEMTLSQQGYWAILRKQLTLAGTWNSTFTGGLGVRQPQRDEWRLALEFMAEKRLELGPLVTHRVTLDELPGILEAMRDKREFTNKAMYLGGSAG